MRISDWSSDVCSSDLFTVRKRRRLSVVADYAVIFVLEPGFPQGVAELVYGREVKRVDDLRWCGHGVNRIEREPHESFNEYGGLRQLFGAAVAASQHAIDCSEG